jgi:hypothetical protein
MCGESKATDSRGSLTAVEGRAQGAVKAEVYKFYAAAMGRNYLVAVFLAGALAQVTPSSSCPRPQYVFLCL